MESAKFEPSAGSVLVVCTGNVCRSPYVERMLEARMAETGLDVSSAGTQALRGSPIDLRVAERLLESGARADGFTARQLMPQMLRNADLILCASREHRTAAVRLEPSALQRTFALVDFADLANVFPEKLPSSDRTPTGASVIKQLVAMVPRFRTRVTPRTAEAATITDPYRRSEQVVSQMATEINCSLQPIESLLRRALMGQM